MAENSSRKTLSIGALARECGVSADTLRHYEHVGVLPRAERQANGYRCYDAALVPRVRLVRQALSIGFTLEELSGILQVRDRGGAPCRKVRALAEEKLVAFEERLNEMIAVRDQLRATLKDWDKRLKRTNASERAYLLENLRMSSVAAPQVRPFTTKTTNHSRKIK